MAEEKDDGFSLAVDGYVNDDHWKAEEMAGHFEVSAATVRRWARGTARPHPRLQKQVLTYIKERS